MTGDRSASRHAGRSGVLGYGKDRPLSCKTREHRLQGCGQDQRSRMPGHDAVPARDPAVQHKRRVSCLQCAAGAPGRLPAGRGSALTLRWARTVCGCFPALTCFFQEPANMNALRQRLPAGKAEVFTMRPFWGMFVEPKLLRALSARVSPVPSVHAASLPQATRLHGRLLP